MEEQSFEGELTFNNTDYLVSVRQIQQTAFDPQNQRLYVEVEEKLTGNLWKGDFQAKYIEDITTKTGVAKKFNVFVKMLIQALRSQSDSVCIDLLTYADLEALKNKKTNSSQQHNQSQLNPSTNTKRYFILTYITEFERVHYPLSLNYVDEPEADQLRRTIERMRNLIMMQRSNTFSSGNGGFFGQGPNSKNMNQTASQAQQYNNNRIEDFASIELENEQLRRQINEMESQFSQSHQEFFNLSQQKFYTESEYDKYKRNAQKEIMTLQDQVRNAEQELAQLQDQLRNQQSVNGSNRVTQTSGFSLNSGQVQNSQLSDVDHVKRQLEEITSQLDQERSTTGTMIEKQEKEIEECKKELDEQKENERKLKLRQKELQDELDHTLRRIEQLQRGVSTPIRRKTPLYSGTGSGGPGSRNASPYSRNSSGNKKGQGTPGSNYGGVGSKSNLYNRTGSNGSGNNNRTTGGGTGVQRQSPTTQNRFGSNTYKPPGLRQSSNTRQSPTTNNRVPIGSQQQRQPSYQRNTSNNRSGSNNNRNGSGGGVAGGKFTSNTNNRPMVGGRYNQNQRTTGQSSTTTSGVYDRLYGNKNQSSSNSNVRTSNGAQVSNQMNSKPQVDYQIPERDTNINNESLNINIQSSLSNKENHQMMIQQQQQQQMIQSQSNKSTSQNNYQNAYEPVVNNRQQEMGQPNSSNYDDIDVKDINSKLSRLQDLLSKAKQQ